MIVVTTLPDHLHFYATYLFKARITTKSCYKVLQILNLSKLRKIHFRQKIQYGCCLGACLGLASHTDVPRGSSRVPTSRMPAELKDKFLSHCSQISAGDHMQIIGDPTGAVDVKVLTRQTHTFKLCRV